MKLVRWSQRTAHSFKKGFTLLEFTVVVGLLGLAIGSTLALLTSVLKGSNQANVNAEVKQNGQVILDSLEKQIRNATSASPILLAALPPNSLSAVSLSISSTEALYIACFTTTPSVNGRIGVARVPFGTPSNTTTYTSLTNTDPISGVDITSCSVSAFPATLDSPDIVSIDFIANQGVNAPSRQDFLANARFNTTISLRKY